MNWSRLRRVIVMCFVLLCTAIAMFGCDELIQRKEEYCIKTSGSITKKALLIAIRMKYPLYPEDGVCTKLPGVS